jgi:hypothetical protein
MTSATALSQATDEATIRRSPRRRSPDKSADFDTAMDDVVPRSKSLSRTFPERAGRPRSPIRKSPKKPIADISRLNLFEDLQDEGKNKFLLNNPSVAKSVDAFSSESSSRHRDEAVQNPDRLDPSKPVDWVPAPSFAHPYTHNGGVGLFGQPSSPISHWPPQTSPQSRSTTHGVGLFGQPITSRSPPLGFDRSPFQSRTLFGHPNNVPLARGLFGSALPKNPRKLVLPSFVDPLDEEIGAWNPEYQVLPLSPPPGILNMPYSANGEEELPDALDPRYDSDWEDRLFDPVPGAGIYLGELRDSDTTPKKSERGVRLAGF